MIPEEFVLAVLHRLGPKRISNNFELTSIFCQKSDIFRMHRHYDMCEKLDDVFQALAHGGSIVRGRDFFQASPHTLGSFGKSVYLKLPDDEKSIVDEIVKEIDLHF